MITKNDLKTQGWAITFFVAFALLLWFGWPLISFPIEGVKQIAMEPTFQKAIIVSLLSVLLYLTLYHYYNSAWTRRLDKLVTTKALKDAIKTNSEKLGGRESSFVQIGAIFIAGAFLLLIASITLLSKDPPVNNSMSTVLALGAPALYGVWLFTMQLSTRLMNDANAHMLRLAKSPIAIFTGDFYGERHGRGILMKARRNHWLGYFVLLIFASMYIA